MEQKSLYSSNVLKKYFYSSTKRAYHTMCISPTSAMQDMLERNSICDVSLLYLRNSMPEMMVNIHVAVE